MLVYKFHRTIFVFSSSFYSLPYLRFFCHVCISVTVLLVHYGYSLTCASCLVICWIRFCTSLGSDVSAPELTWSCLNNKNQIIVKYLKKIWKQLVTNLLWWNDMRGNLCEKQNQRSKNIFFKYHLVTDFFSHSTTKPNTYGDNLYMFIINSSSKCSLTFV